MKPSGRGTRAAFFLFATLVTVCSQACGGLSPSSAAESDAAAHNRSARGRVGHGCPNLRLFRSGEAVGIGEDGEVYLVTVATGEITPTHH